jgi:hypothetical protein
MQYVEYAEPDEDLLRWLAGLDTPQLARVLAKRPDVLEPPWPRRLTDLSVRLSAQESIVAATRELTSPAVQIMCAWQLCQALGDDNGVPVATLAGWLGASAAEVTFAVEPLADLALAWIDRAGLVQVPEAMKGNAYARYRLGQPLAPVLSRLTNDQLRDTSKRLGLPAGARKQQLVDSALAFFRDGEQVRKLVADAPVGVAEVLDDFVSDGPEREVDLGFSHIYFRRAHEVETPAAWAVRHYLLVATYEGDAHMPLEVGLALRGPDYRLPFTPNPPRVAVAPVAPERVAAETSASALRLLDRTTTVVEAAAAEPFSLLKTGGIGTRVIKKLAKDTGAATEEIKLVLELAFDTGLLVAEEPPPPPARKSRSRKAEPAPPARVVPTEEFTRWRGAGSAAQLRTLLCAWWRLPTYLLGDEPVDVSADIRHLILRLHTELDAGTGAVDNGALADLVAWHTSVDPGLLHNLVSVSLAEAALVGAIASNAAGELARALVSGGADLDIDAPELVKATDELVAGACATALFGTDLTAIVTGPPGTELAALLDRVADRETQGSASTWRFSPASVRRALDNGEAPTALIDELGSVARGQLPQPLTYLINDIARRHGEVGVMDVRSVIVGENPGLLAEIAAHRKLAKLSLGSVAPSVLTSTADAATTLTALRDAGYAPVHRASDGSIVVRNEKPPVAVAEPFDDDIRELLDARPAVVQDPLEHAERLLNTPTTAPRALKRGALMNILPGNRSAPWMRLIWQLETGFPVWVSYQERDGKKEKLLVSDPELHGDAIDVWCEDPGGYRRLELSRISPAKDAPEVDSALW